MHTMFMKFFEPYFFFLLGAAYNIQQSLEGLGLSSSNFLIRDESGAVISSYFSTQEAAMAPLGLLLLYSILLLLALLLSGYVIGRKKGALVVILVAILPGILNMLDMWPVIQYIPHSFSLGGTGELGSVWGFIPITFLGLSTGWTLVVLATDVFNLKSKFRNFYDHLWYLSAILAGLFFVVDDGSTKLNQKLAEAYDDRQHASLYLLSQLKEYDAYCAANELMDTYGCVWASRFQQKLNEYATSYSVVFAQFGPESIEELFHYGNEPAEDWIVNVRTQIKAYNEEQCPVGASQYSKHCQMIPAKFCTQFPFDSDGLIDQYQSVRLQALSSECILPTLISFKKREAELVDRLREAAMAKHYRWFYFVLFAVFVGGKIATSTTKLFRLDERGTLEKGRSYKAIVKPFVLILRLLKASISFIKRIIALKSNE